MEKYRKIRVVGKGSFGHALLVQSKADQQQYIIKVCFHCPLITQKGDKRRKHGEEKTT